MSKFCVRNYYCILPQCNNFSSSSRRCAVPALFTDAVVHRVDPLKRSLFQLVQEELFSPLGQSIYCPPVSSEDWEGRGMSKVHDIPLSTIMLGVLPQIYLSRFYRSALGDDHPIVLSDSEVNLYRSVILKDDPESPHYWPGLPDMDNGAASCNNRSGWFSYPMMSANCVTNARGTGNALDAFMSGKVVSQETLSLVLKPVVTNEFDIWLQANTTYSAGGFGHGGVGQDAGLFKPPAGAECTGWGGFGGSTIVHCLIGAYNVTLSYVPNGLSPRVNLDRGMKLLSEVVGILLEE